MNVIKSLLLLLFFLLMICASVHWLVRALKTNCSKIQRIVRTALAACCLSITLLAVAAFGDYLYPFEREIKPILFEEIDVPEEYAFKYPGQKFWHGAYNQYGLYAESFYFDSTISQSNYGFQWPELNFDQNNYIITYGQKIESLSYNVWDTIDSPIRTGAKAGHMVLEATFSPQKIYIYRIPKIRIENDLNAPI